MELPPSSEVMSGLTDEVSEEGNSDINAASQDAKNSGDADIGLMKKRMMAMKCQVKDLNDKSKGEIELKDSVFAVEPRKDLLARTVNWQLAKRRSGTHKVKLVGDISGTTAKPFRQKGTGRARQGSARATQFRGGATVHGPVVRSHAYKLPKKIRKLALKSALSSKQVEGKAFGSRKL